MLFGAPLWIGCGDAEPDSAADPALSTRPVRVGSPAGPPPNVLLIVLDTTRRDRLSTYGYDRLTSPVLDHFATRALVYENAISSGSWTLPAHASLFTGMFARDHLTTIENMKLDPSFTTLAELFRDNGYDTAAFTCNPWIAAHTGLDQGFQTLVPVWSEIDRDNGPDYHGAMEATRGALAWIDERASAGRPFFMFINYLEPHAPYRPRGEWRERFLPPGTDRAAVDEVSEWKTPREFGYMLGVPGYAVSQEQFELIGALYDADVAYQDFRLGELLDGLDVRGLRESTVIAIVADHGEQLGEHGMMDHKMTLYEENIRVPLLLSYPGRLPAGVRLAATVQTHDLFPTLTGLAGIEFDPPYGSRPLPLGQGQDGPGRRYTFVEFGRPTLFMKIMTEEWPDAGIKRFDRQLRSIRGEGFKLIWTSDGRHELYDLEVDPAEQVNLAAERPVQLAELRRLLLGFHAGRMDMIDADPGTVNGSRRRR